MIVYRIFPYDSRAAVDETGGPLFIPAGGGGRVDNPNLYRTLYVSSHAEGAVAEVFGRFPEWDDAMFVHASGLSYALAAYELANETKVFSLDDAEHLIRLGLKPSDVVRRDLRRSQRWGREIFEMREWAGVSWWSFYGPQWQSIALWDLSCIRLAGEPAVLTVATEAVRTAAGSIVRLIRSS